MPAIQSHFRKGLVTWQILSLFLQVMTIKETGGGEVVEGAGLRIMSMGWDGDFRGFCLGQLPAAIYFWLGENSLLAAG
jgi:hypothetical protein